MKKIILANALTQSGNRGCVALTVSAMLLLQEILDAHHTEYTFYLPQSGYPAWESGEHTFQSDDVSLTYTAIINPSFYTPRNFIECMGNRKRYQDAKKAYKEADAIFDLGQGDSFADIYGKPRFQMIYSQYKLGMKYDIPYCIMPQTIGPFEDAEIRAQAVKGIQNAELVFARDQQSAAYVHDICASKNVTECVDLAFFMPYKQRQFDKNKLHVGLNVSALLWNGGYTRDNQFDLKSDYQELIRAILDYFLSMEDVMVHLVPHVVSGERSVENDYAVSSDLVRAYDNPNLVLAPLFLDPIEAKGYISGLDFFMGARMHSTIAAFSSCVPVCPMAYSRKFNGLFQDTLHDQYLLDMKACDLASSMDMIKDSFAHRKDIHTLEEIQMQTTVTSCRDVLTNQLTQFLKLT